MKTLTWSNCFNKVNIYWISSRVSKLEEIYICTVDLVTNSQLEIINDRHQNRKFNTIHYREIVLNFYFL